MTAAFATGHEIIRGFGTTACPKEGSQRGAQFESLGHPLFGGLKVCNIEQTAPCAFAMLHSSLGSKGTLPGKSLPTRATAGFAMAVRRAPLSEDVESHRFFQSEPAAAYILRITLFDMAAWSCARECSALGRE
jgi:hypothetical protein